MVYTPNHPHIHPHTHPNTHIHTQNRMDLQRSRCELTPSSQNQSRDETSELCFAFVIVHFWVVWRMCASLLTAKPNTQMKPEPLLFRMCSLNGFQKSSLAIMKHFLARRGPPPPPADHVRLRHCASPDEEGYFGCLFNTTLHMQPYLRCAPPHRNIYVWVIMPTVNELSLN